MNRQLEQKKALFVRNNEKLLKKFWYKSNNIVKLSSVMLTAKDMEADIDRIKEAKKIIKAKTGFFSNLRGNLAVPIRTMISMADDPAAYCDDLLRVYKATKKGHLPTEFMLMTAMTLCSHKDHIDIDQTVETLFRVYDAMNEKHPFLTGQSDLCTAALFAMTCADPLAKVEEADDCYTRLNDYFMMANNEVLAMSCILALSDKPVESKCQQALAVREALKAKGYQISRSMYLPILGGFGISNRLPEAIAEEVNELQLALKGTAGFGTLSATKYGRFLFAMILSMICDDNVSGVQESAISTTLLNMIINEMIMTMVIVSSSTRSGSSK